MDDILTKIIPIALAIGVVLDAISGYLPQKWIPYIGLTRRIVRRVLGIDKKE